MRDLTSVIEGMRKVREARNRFMCLWWLDRLPAGLSRAPAALDRLEIDINAADIARADDYAAPPAGMEVTPTEGGMVLKSRTTRLFPPGRLADD